MPSSAMQVTASAVEVTENRTQAAEWNAYVANHPHSSFFHQYEWLTLIEETYGGTPYYLTARQEGQIVGVLPLMQRRVVGGRILMSVPYADEGGLLADGVEAEGALLEAARELGHREGVGYVELRQAVALESSCLVDCSRITLKLGLPPTTEELWKSFKTEIRNRVRKAEQARLVAVETTELHSAIEQGVYRVYSHNTRDLGSPMHRREFFHRLADLFPGKVRAVRVLLDDVAIGAAITTIHNGIFSVPWVGSLRSHFALCPNNLLYWKMMMMAIEEQCSVFDFGRSAKESGTHHFKQRWGAKEYQLFYSLLPITATPQVGEKKENGAYQVFSKVWQKTPLPLARTIGPKLFARLPL